MKQIKEDTIEYEEDYEDFIQPYIDAMNNLGVRIEVLNKDFRRKYKNYPIHNIQSRIKSEDSMMEKLRRKDLDVSLETAKNYLMDIAGIRIICYFVQDVYYIVQMLKKQADMVLMKETDYIARNKDNGYRSYHMVLGIPVYHADGMEYYPVEVQVRTMAMDFWASMEHRLCYKGRVNDKELLKDELYDYANILEQIEGRMEKFYYRDEPERYESP